VETPPFSLKLNFFGVGDMNFFMNSASIPIVFCLVFFNWLLWKTLSLIARNFYRFRCCRKLGMYVEPRITLRYGIFKIFSEGYIELVLASILGTLAILFLK